MNPKKDEYMRGYSDGFKDGRAQIHDTISPTASDTQSHIGDAADLIEELRQGVPVAEETANGGELYDIEAANETMAQAAHVLSKLTGF